MNSACLLTTRHSILNSRKHGANHLNRYQLLRNNFLHDLYRSIHCSTKIDLRDLPSHDDQGDDVTNVDTRKYHHVHTNDRAKKWSNIPLSPLVDHQQLQHHPQHQQINISTTLHGTHYFLYTSTTTWKNASYGHLQSVRLFSQGRTTTDTDTREETSHMDGNKERMREAATKGRNAVSKGATSLKDLVRKYGFTFVGTYFSVWVLTLSTLFGVIDSGLVDPATLSNIQLPWHSGTGAEEEAAAAEAKEIKSSVELIASYMEKYEWTKSYADKVEENPRISNFAIAVVATKLTEPIRIAVTMGIVPRISRALGRHEVSESPTTKE